MPRLDYKTCKGCGKHADEVGPLSWTRQCADCGKARLIENVDGLHDHTGEALQRWRRGMVACAGGVLLDDLQEKA
jgi:hypothetical protein